MRYFSYSAFWLTSQWEGAIAPPPFLATLLYLRKCIDLKPVPIIRFIFQFGFRIVWNSDPSEFDILKSPSLPAAVAQK